MRVDELQWRPYKRNDDYDVAEFGDHIVYRTTRVRFASCKYVVFENCKEGDHINRHGGQEFALHDDLQLQCVMLHLLGVQDAAR